MNLACVNLACLSRSHRNSLKEREESMEISGEENNPDNTLEEGELSAPPKRQPISLEELLERKAHKEKQESRPLYVSKEERAQKALDKRKKVG